jgi:hypothetical protein
MTRLRLGSRGGNALAAGMIAGCLTISTPSFADRQLQFGVGTHVNAVGPVLAALRELDAGFRDDIQWFRIERTENVLQYPSSFAALDQMIADAGSRHKSPVILLPGGNKLYDGGGQLSSPEAMKAFARYAAFVARQLKGRATQIEVWNEWEEGGGAAKNAPTKGDPVAYANLLRETYPAIKAANPNTIVIAGAIAGSDTAWVKKFAEAGGLQFLDAFSIHPYVQCNAAAPLAPTHFRISSQQDGHPLKGGTVTMAANTTALEIIGGTPEQSMALVDELKDTLNELAPGRSLLIYVTEIGWPTSASKCGVSETVAAAYLQRYMLLAASRPYVAGVWWYDLFDDGPDQANPEHRFGLMHQDHSPKATYKALAGLSNVLGSPHVATQSLGSRGEIIISGKQADGKEFYATWLPTNSITATQPSAEVASKASSGFRALASTDLQGSSPSDSLSAFPKILVQQ